MTPSPAPAVDTLRRITPKEAAALFRKHRIKPVRSQHLDPDYRSGGVLGALAVDRLGREAALKLVVDARSVDDAESRTIAPALGLHPDYAHGLTIGFSDHWTERELSDLADRPWSTPEFRRGFTDGEAIREKVKPW